LRTKKAKKHQKVMDDEGTGRMQEATGKKKVRGFYDPTIRMTRMLWIRWL